MQAKDRELRENQTVRQQLISSQRQNQELRQRVSQVCLELMQCNEVLLTAGDCVSAGQGQGAKRESDSQTTADQLTETESRTETES